MTPPITAAPPQRWQRLLAAGAVWIGGAVLAVAAGVGVNALLGAEAGRAAFRFVLYSTFFGAILFGYGRSAGVASWQGSSLGFAVTLLRWVLDRVW
jgi:hypothetical protein